MSWTWRRCHSSLEPRVALEEGRIAGQAFEGSSSPRWQSRHLGVQVVDPICESHKRVGAAAGVPGYDKRRKIFGICLFHSLGALSAFRSVSLAGAVRQQPSCHRGCTGGTSASASTRIAPHRTHHNGNRRTTMRRQHADIEHVDRSDEHARDEHQQHVRVLQNHASARALPHPRERSPPCKSARARTWGAGPTHR